MLNYTVSPGEDWFSLPIIYIQTGIKRLPNSKRNISILLNKHGPDSLSFTGVISLTVTELLLHQVYENDKASTSADHSA